MRLNAAPSKWVMANNTYYAQEKRFSNVQLLRHVMSCSDVEQEELRAIRKKKFIIIL